MADRAKLAWQTLDAANPKLPQKVRDAVKAYDMARAVVEHEITKALTPTEGKKIAFAYRYGVAIAFTDIKSGTGNYFA